MEPRVLVVEDEGIVAMDLASRLEDLRYEVVGIAFSGKEAIRIAEVTFPEIVLMDIGLQGETEGIEVAEIMKEKYKAEIIFLTGYTDKKIKNQLEAIEPLGILTKPVDDQELIATLKKYNYEKKLKL